MRVCVCVQLLYIRNGMMEKNPRETTPRLRSRVDYNFIWSFGMCQSRFFSLPRIMFVILPRSDFDTTAEVIPSTVFHIQTSSARRELIKCLRTTGRTYYGSTKVFGKSYSSRKTRQSSAQGEVETRY